MTHACTFTSRRDYLMLSLPERDGRYWLLQQHYCTCGKAWTCTSYAQNTGRHPTLDELRGVHTQETTQRHRQGVYPITTLPLEGTR